MKNNYCINLKKGTFFVFFFLLLFISYSCKKETESNVGFSINGNPTLLEVGKEGASKEFTVQSSGYWKVRPVTDEKWVKIDPIEGSGNGSFTITVSENSTIDERAVTLAFLAGDRFSSETLKIEQEAGTHDEQQADPFVKIEGIEEDSEISDKGISERLFVRANGEWKIEIPSDVDWVTIEPISGKGDVPVQVFVDINKASKARSVALALSHNGSALGPLVLTQQALRQEIGDILLNEDFNWLTYATKVLYTVTGETRFDSWTQDEIDKGWSSSVNPVAGSGGTPLLYARNGFVKLGKTQYSGDLISPKLEAIAGTRNVKVTFKAVPYMTKAGTKDDNVLNVNVIGPGTIEGDNDMFVLDNWPDYDIDPEGLDIWSEPQSTYSFIIKDATEETQFRFLGQDFDMRTPKNPNKNRIFIDDIVVEITED